MPQFTRSVRLTSTPGAVFPLICLSLGGIIISMVIKSKFLPVFLPVRLLSICLILLSVTVTAPAEEGSTLWYDQPASEWIEALPLGNGRLGGMVVGSVPNETIHLNEESLWAGEPADAYPDKFADNLKILQQLVMEGKIFEASEFGREKMVKAPTCPSRKFRPCLLTSIYVQSPTLLELRQMIP